MLARFAVQDVAFRVVGTGSVGRSNWIVLLKGNGDEPLVLQVKQAVHSALADYLPPVSVDHQGERVVRGQRHLQLSSDRLLGWTRVGDQDCYVRQFRDMKGGIDATTLKASELIGYGRLTGAHLAWAHSFGADPRVLAGYCGHGHTLGKAMVGRRLRRGRSEREGSRRPARRRSTRVCWLPRAGQRGKRREHGQQAKVRQ